MKKIFNFLFIFLIGLFLITPSLSAAVKEEKPALQWHCLESKICSDKTARCSGKGNIGHRAKLTTKKDDLPAPNKETYILVCISTELGNVCTTGDSQLDLKTVGYDGVMQLKQSKATGGYEFQGLFLPDGETEVPKDKIRANEKGEFFIPGLHQTKNHLSLIKEIYASVNQPKYQITESLEWQDYTPEGIGRKWLALNFVEPVTIPLGQGGQQQRTFTFEGALSKCAGLAWDPYGIVFDSQSLEPVAGAKITLLKKRAANTYTMVGPDEVISLLNPLYTDEAGSFAFFVPDGIYRLDVSHANFIFPNDPVKLHPNFAKIYSDIYRGEDIVQKGKIEHRDIPLDAKGSPYQSPIKVLSYFETLDKATNTYIIEGRVSHPLTKIQIFGKKLDKASGNNFIKTNLLISSKADKQGKFEIRYNLNKLEPGEFVGEIEFIKTNLTTITTADVLGAATSSVNLTLNPILNYIEGYAYNKNGQVIPNANVMVYLNLAHKPVYETKADEKGYFKITSEYLPPFPYKLKYITPTGISYQTTTSEFLAQNSQFIENKKTDLYSFKNQSGQVLKAKPERLVNNQQQQKQQQEDSSYTKKITPISSQKITQPNNLIIIVVILFLLISIVAILLSFYYLKRKTTSFDNPNQ